MVLFINVIKERAERLLKKGFVSEPLRTVYEQLRLRKNGVTIILYNSGKLLLQGKNLLPTQKLIQKLQLGKLQEPERFRTEIGTIIGSDEVLKGDTFGGIVVAAVRAEEKTREQLREWGVADSKTLSDKEILIMAEKIKKIASCEIKSFLPKDYNNWKEGVTNLLNKLHQQAANDLHPGQHIVDKYPGCTVGDIAVEKAESKYIEVAAASVLARAAGLQQLEFLSLQAGFTLPKGSAHVKLALHELWDRKLDFSKFVKIDFRNVQEFLREMNSSKI